MPMTRSQVVSQALMTWDLGLLRTLGFVLDQSLDGWKEQHFLEVAGARLHYRIIGSGPLVLLIPGANGNGGIFQPLAYALSKHYTVVTYSRRGFSLSTLQGAQDYSVRLQTDADDAASLIKQLNGGQPAYVLGNSSGAIVSMELTKRHPSLVKKVVVHEPPALAFDPKGDEFADILTEVRHLFYNVSLDAAISRFVNALGEGLETGMMSIAMRTRDPANVKYWFDHEARHYPMTPFTGDFLVEHKDKVVPALGEETEVQYHEGKNAPLYVPLVNISKFVEKEPLIVPGGHVGFLLQPARFAKLLEDVFI